MRFIQTLCAARGIPLVGVCAFAGLPILPVGSRRRIPPGAQSCIVALFPYRVPEPPRYNLSRYAWIPDYHLVAGEMLGEVCSELQSLYPGERFVPFVDASPIGEVSAAVAAGLGVLGDNGQLITPRYGSYVFIGEILTTLSLPPDQPMGGECLHCGRCAAVCPGGCIGPQGIDIARCRSHLSQKKGALAPEEEEALRQGGLAWGCDLCLQACPMNQGAAYTPIPAFLQDVQPVLTEENLPVLLRNRAFAWRGEAVLRRNLRLLEP